MNKSSARKLQLVQAAVHEIGEAGTLNVTVSQIAKRAGVSSALAFHYFGDKDQLFIGAMRHILSLYGAEIRGGLRGKNNPYERLQAIVQPNFTPSNFRKEVVSAWLNFYVLAQVSDEAARLLLVYQKRLKSNLTSAFRPLIAEGAPLAATRIAALIDGLYLRSVQSPNALNGSQAISLTMAAIDHEIGAKR